MMSFRGFPNVARSQLPSQLFMVVLTRFVSFGMNNQAYQEPIIA